jgi:PEP-CTERM motif-containing protein
MSEKKTLFGGKGFLYAFVLSSAFTATLRANAILSTGSLNCTFALANPVSNTDCGPSGTNLALVSQLPQQANGIAGVAYGLSGTLTDTSAGTNSPFNTSLTLSTSGVPAGTGVAATVPVAMGWDFILALGFVEGHTQINNWTLTFDLRDVTAGNVSLFSSLPTITSGALNITNTTPVTFTGGQAFNLTSSIVAAHTLQQIAVLTINWTGQNNNSDNLAIQFAAHGLDFNDAPEPATLGLSGAALAMVVWFARRRRFS